MKLTRNINIRTSELGYKKWQKLEGNKSEIFRDLVDIMDKISRKKLKGNRSQIIRELLKIK